MSEYAELLREQGARLFEREASRAGGADANEAEIPGSLWDAIEAAGLCDVMVAEEAGGAGAGLVEALVLARLAGAHAAPVPLVETILVRWMLASLGRRAPTGPASLAILRNPEGRQVALPGVPWGRAAATLIAFVPAGDGWEMRALDPRRAEIDRNTNLAGEPRDLLRFDARAFAEAATTLVDPELMPGGPLALLALFRAAQMTGAMASALDIAVRYAGERVQFGRPISRFQAVQQIIAAMAGDIAASTCATDAAALAPPDAMEIMISAAKARTGEAAGRVAAGAHQVLGAMGYTREHRLHRYTRRLWAWRDEAGNEVHWQENLFRLIAQTGTDPWHVLAPLGAETAVN